MWLKPTAADVVVLAALDAHGGVRFSSPGQFRMNKAIEVARKRPYTLRSLVSFVPVSGVRSVLSTAIPAGTHITKLAKTMKSASAVMVDAWSAAQDCSDLSGSVEAPVGQATHWVTTQGASARVCRERML